MQHFSIPACYFPSTALFIDDSRDFLLNFVLQLDEGLAYRLFDSPFDALDFLHKKHQEIHTLTQRCLMEYTESLSLPDSTTNAGLAAIQKEIYNRRRFAEISVVVVDYAMPGMDGIEFCRRLAGTNIKKILLTGKADEKLAIEAFNEGLIQRFIQKSDINAADLITNSINDLQWQYFQNMTDTMMQMMALQMPVCLNDPQFSSFFKQFCQEKRIVEHYLANEAGSFLLFDDDAKPSTLIVMREAERHADYELARSLGASSEVLEHIASGEKILGALSNEKNLSLLIPAQQLQGNNAYSYAHIAGSTLNNLREESVFSYHSYLDEIDAEELLLI